VSGPGGEVGMGVAVYYDGDTVLALARVDFVGRRGRQAERASIFEYLVRSARDGHFRRVSVVSLGGASCDLAPRAVASDADAVRWLRDELDRAVKAAMAKADPKSAELKASVVVREVHTTDWAKVSKVAAELGAETMEAEVNQETGEIRGLGGSS
jgi:hypothetical protein